MGFGMNEAIGCWAHVSTRRVATDYAAVKCRANARTVARLMATVVFPAPPFWLPTRTIMIASYPHCAFTFDVPRLRMWVWFECDGRSNLPLV